MNYQRIWQLGYNAYYNGEICPFQNSDPRTQIWYNGWWAAYEHDTIPEIETI